MGPGGGPMGRGGCGRGGRPMGPGGPPKGGRGPYPGLGMNNNYNT